MVEVLLEMVEVLLEMVQGVVVLASRLSQHPKNVKTLQ